MPKENDPIERAKRRFREVQEIMARAAQVRQEYYDLESLLRQAHHVYPDAFDEWPLPGMEGGPPMPIIKVDAVDSTMVTDNAAAQASKPGGTLRTSDFAEWVLKVHGPLRIRELMRHMREEGWHGNRDENKAEKTLFNVMASHRDRFENLGKNLWGLTKKEK